MTQDCALGLVARIAETGLRLHTFAMLALWITDGLTVVGFCLGVTLMAHALSGILAAAVLSTFWAAHWFALLLIRPAVSLLALTFSRLEASAVWSTVGLANRITLARLSRRVTFQTIALIGLLAELIRSTTWIAHWLTCTILGDFLVALNAFANSGFRAEAVRPTARVAYRLAVTYEFFISLLAGAGTRRSAVTVLSTNSIALWLTVIYRSIVTLAAKVFGIPTLW